MTLGIRTRSFLAAAACAVVATASIEVATGGPAAAIDSTTESTTANVGVTGAITLTALTDAFTLTGIPGATVTTGASPVTMTVTTNNDAGYQVTVEPEDPSLVGTIVGNDDLIPTTLLKVRETGGSTFTALTPGTPLVVTTKTERSAEEGDTVSNDYQITIPFVQPDTYSGTLDYIASTLGT